MQTRLRALLEPAINKKRESNKSEHRAYRHEVREYKRSLITKMNKGAKIKKIRGS